MHLPVLNPQFFIQHPPTREFFQTWKNLGPWSENLVPIYHWNGILYIGCTSSDHKLKLAIPHVLIRAEPIDLKNVWDEYTLDKAKANQQEVPQSPPETQQVFNIDQNPAAKEEENLFSFLEEQNSSSPKQGDGGLELVDESPVEESAPTEQAPPAEELLSFEVNEDAPSSPQFPPAPKLEAASEVTPEVKPFSDDETPPKEPTVKVSTPKTPPVSVPPVSAPPKTSTGHSSHWTDMYFDQLNSRFEKSMILLVNNNQALPYKWNAGFSLESEQANPINLDNPSPFRVVNRTKKSYFGPVAPSEIMESFSADWAKGRYPSNFIAVPLMLGERLIGMLCTQFENKNLDMNQLQFCEKVGVEISKEITKNPASLKAA